MDAFIFKVHFKVLKVKYFPLSFFSKGVKAVLNLIPCFGEAKHKIKFPHLSMFQGEGSGNYLENLTKI